MCGTNALRDLSRDSEECLRVATGYRRRKAIRTQAVEGRLLTTLLPIAERSLLVTSPKERQDDHTDGRRIGTPYGRESVALDGDHNQQDGKVRGAKNHHHLYLGEKECTAGNDQINQCHGSVVGCLIDIHNAVLLDVKLQRKCSQRPQYIKSGRSSKYDERKHSVAAFLVWLEEKNAERSQERKQPLRIKHERRAH